MKTLLCNPVYAISKFYFSQKVEEKFSRCSKSKSWV